MSDLESKVSAYFDDAKDRVKKEDVGKVLSQSDRILEILTKNKLSKQEIAKVRLLLKMLKDYRNGVYTEVSWHTISAIVVTLLYIISPINLVPFIPVFLFPYSTLILILLWKHVREDVRSYARWKYSTTRDEEIKSLYRKVFGEELAVKGSTIFIYGPEESGKTTLAKFLVEGEIYEKYIPTREIEFYVPTGKKIKLSKFEFDIEKIVTGPGSVYPDIDIKRKILSFKILKESEYDYLFYIFDVSKIFNNDDEYIQCIDADVELMKKYVKNRNILLIGTHLDKLNLKNIKEDRKAIEEQILNTQVVTEMISELQKNNKSKGPLIGSLKDKTEAGKLKLLILEAMHELKKA